MENDDQKNPEVVEEVSETDGTEKLVKRFKINDRTLAILVLGLIVVFIVGSDPYFRRAKLERRACRTLRSIGSSQLAYQGTNNEKWYGTFEALQDTLYIADGYNLGNMIEGYELEWDINNIEDYYGGYGIGQNLFTVVAYPFISYPPKLRTFGITEDQVVRVYNPKMGSKFNGRDDPIVKSWEAVPYKMQPRFREYFEKVKDFFGL